MIPEILAPAGSMEALKAAVYAGADAVYLGGSRFGARAFADNFNDVSLIQGIEYCHVYGVKVYLTVNTLFRDEEIDKLYEYLAPLYEAGLDAVIVQDLGVMYYIHQQFPDLPIHASTQMTVTTEYAYMLLRDYGVTRIVPARELSIEEIKALKCVPENEKGVPEVEVFVQGALCYCYSGQCLMSSMLGGRSGNRGRCAQTCRLPYFAYDENGGLMKGADVYLLSMKDLCGLDAVPELIQAGVDSFKIEGRMKRPEYVAACVRAYRRVVDAWNDRTYSQKLLEICKKEMAEVFNRGGFTNGYYHQKNGKDMISSKAPGNVGVIIGRIEDIQKNKLLIRLTEDVFKGDILVISKADGQRISSRNQEEKQITLTCNVEGKKNGQIVLSAPKTKVLHKGQTVSRMLKAPLMKELSIYSQMDKPIALQGTIEIKLGSPVLFTLNMENRDGNHLIIETGDVPESAKKNPITREIVMDKIEKIGNMRYYFENLDITMDDNIFYSMKLLKELRRTAIAHLEQAVLEQKRRIPKARIIISDVRQDNLSNRQIDMKQLERPSVVVSSDVQFQTVIKDGRMRDIYLDLQYFEKEDIIDIINNCDTDQRIYLVLPPVLRLGFIDEIDTMLDWAEKKSLGIVIRNLDELAYIRYRGYTGMVVADYSLYVMNAHAAAFIRRQFPHARITLPVELNEKQLQALPFLKDNCEMEVYGYQQLMISAQCIQNTTGRCNGQNALLQIKDRYNKRFYVKSVCKYCYTLYYNSVPTVLFDLVTDHSVTGVMQRLHFTKETEREVQNVLDAFFENQSWNGEKTRGHYNRGVE